MPKTKSLLPTLEPGPTCNGINRSKKRKRDYCINAMGAKTDHPGEGRCILHAGGSKVKHGRASTLSRYTNGNGLGQRIADLKARPDLFKLNDELALLQDSLQHFIKGLGSREFDENLRKELRAFVETIASVSERAHRIDRAWSDERADAFLEYLATSLARILEEQFGQSDKTELVKLKIAEMAEKVQV